jgi:hypothetical protein
VVAKKFVSLSFKFFPTIQNKMEEGSTNQHKATKQRNNKVQGSMVAKQQMGVLKGT